MLKRVLSVSGLLLMLAVMLGFGVCGGRNAGQDGVDDEENILGIGVVMEDTIAVRVRKAPSTSAEIVAVLRGGTEVTVLAEEDGFYQITAEIEGEETVEGYMKANLIRMKVYFRKNNELK